MNGKVQCTYDKNIAILPHGVKKIHRDVLQFLSLPIAVPSIVDTRMLKSLRSMGSVMLGAVITTQYFTLEFGPSITVRFIGGSISIVTPAQ